MINEEIQRNKILEEENKELKESLNNIKQSQTIEVNRLIVEIEKLKSENEKLKSDLFKTNKVISGIKNNQNNQNNQTDNNELKKLKDENINLRNQLNLKDNEIKNLKMRIQNNSIERPKYDLNDIMVINFISMDSTVNEGMACLEDDAFVDVEKKLYEKYEDLKNTNNMFTANAKPVLRFKTLKENGIKNGNKIQLFKLE